MSFTWDLPFPNQTGTACAGAPIIDIIPEPSYFALVKGITVPIMIFIGLGMIAIFFLHDRFLFLKARPLYPNLTFGVVCICFNVFTMKLELSGRHSVSCRTFLGIMYTSMGLSTVSFTTSLLLYIIRLVETKMLVRDALQFESGQIGKREFSREPKFSEVFRALWNNKGGFVLPTTHESETISPHKTLPLETTPTKASNSADVMSESSLNGVVWGHRSSLKYEVIIPIALLTVGMVPTMLFYVIRWYTDPLLINNCVGCETDYVDIALMWVAGSEALCLALFAFWTTRREPDPLQIKAECITALCLIMPIGAFSWVWRYVNPTPHDTYKFSYYLLTDLGFFSMYMVQSWLQIFKAVRMRDSARRNQKQNLHIDVLVKNELAYSLLLKHCTNELCAENLMFYNEVRKWKIEWEYETSPVVRERARIINAMFLSRDSPFEINLSGDVREGLAKRIKQGSSSERLPSDLFDRALREIGEVLSHDILPRFFASTEFKEKILASNMIDQFHVGNHLSTKISLAKSHGTVPSTGVPLS